MATLATLHPEECKSERIDDDSNINESWIDLELKTDIADDDLVTVEPSNNMSWADEAHRQSQWQKQIDYGKNTLGYQTYIKLIPKQVNQA
jgi:hypothetical protein